MNSLEHYTFKFLEMIKEHRHNIEKSDLECLNRAIRLFLKNGNKEDAFIVYYCFSEIFKIFGGGYDNTQKLLELLADYEYFAGSLLQKHRDHYCHSVYILIIGMALYANDEKYQKAYNQFYNIQNGYEDFLYHWGLTALFHDIGYPFQLTHEQVKDYTEQIISNKDERPSIVFNNLDQMIKISPDGNRLLQESLQTDTIFDSIDSLLAYGISIREKYDYEMLKEILNQRVAKPSKFIDHGYFSAVLLGKNLLESHNNTFDEHTLDVLTAILLHNSLNKFDITNAHRISCSTNPLAYLLILCDELQDWDRVAFGKTSKRDPIGWDIDIEISTDHIGIVYYFDTFYKEQFLLKGETPKLPEKNKNVAKLQSGEFVKKIGEYLELHTELLADAIEKPKLKMVYKYASDDNFINLCDFAKVIHLNYTSACERDDIMHINDVFANLPLELKISNIEQAKSYAQKLELINCFYSDKELDYAVVKSFDDNIYEDSRKKRNDLEYLCREEHVRWVKEKLSMGWHYGTSYTKIDDPKRQREVRDCLKEHKDLVPYERLTAEEQRKDEIAINNIIPLLYTVGNNIKIYRYRFGRKPDLEIAGVGHRYFVGDREKIKEQVREILVNYDKNYRIVVRTCFAAGADQLIAECAMELNIPVKAVLPMEYERYIKSMYAVEDERRQVFTAEDEIKMRHLLAQTVVCKSVEDIQHTYLAAGKYIVNKCHKLIAIWDGIESKLFDKDGNAINQGGTYHCIQLARQRGLVDKEDIHIISCTR